MKAAMDQHRLSSLALGHKHRYGIDGVPQDLEQTFGSTVELQWLEHLWNHEDMFETGVVRANDC